MIQIQITSVSQFTKTICHIFN